MANTKTTRPKPPAGLSDEALIEWDRICDELAAAGTLRPADRAILTIYCRTWQTWNAVAKVVAVDGPVVLLPNNWPGESQECKVMTAQAKMLSKFLEQLGLTPASRKTSPTEDATPDEITY